MNREERRLTTLAFAKRHRFGSSLSVALGVHLLLAIFTAMWVNRLVQEEIQAEDVIAASFIDMTERTPEVKRRVRPVERRADPRPDSPRAAAMSSLVVSPTPQAPRHLSLDPREPQTPDATELPALAAGITPDNLTVIGNSTGTHNLGAGTGGSGTVGSAPRTAIRLQIEPTPIRIEPITQTAGVEGGQLALDADLRLGIHDILPSTAKPLRVVYCLDVSGSMSDAMLRDVIYETQISIRGLSVESRVSIVKFAGIADAFDDDGLISIREIDLTEVARYIERRLGGSRSQGTRFLPPLNEAYRHNPTDIVLITDGKASEPEYSVQRAVRASGNSSTRLYVIGINVGAGSPEARFLSSLAEATDG